MIQMRPKASQDNLQFAAAFAECLSVRSDDLRANTTAIRCKGPTSLFAALRIGIPEIVRDHYGVGQKGAVSEIELNKFLVRSGYITFRYRQRIRGAKDKWSKGVHLWKHIRWLDPSSPNDLDLIKRQLSQLRLRFSGSYSIRESEVLSFLSSLRTRCSEKDDSATDSNSVDTRKQASTADPSGCLAEDSLHRRRRCSSQSNRALAIRPSAGENTMPSRQLKRQMVEAIPHSYFTTTRRWAACIPRCFLR